MTPNYLTILLTQIQSKRNSKFIQPKNHKTEVYRITCLTYVDYVVSQQCGKPAYCNRITGIFGSKDNGRLKDLCCAFLREPGISGNFG